MSSEGVSENCPRSGSGVEVAPAVSRSREAELQKLRRYRRRVLHDLWSPAQIGPCGGPGKCPWCAPGEVCECKGDGTPCACERRVFRALTEEGLEAFGGVLSPMAASLIIQTGRAAQNGDPRAMELKVRLFEVLLKDMRAREALELQARRLKLEEARAKRKGPSLSGVIEGARARRREGAPARDVEASTSETPGAVEAQEGAPGGTA